MGVAGQKHRLIFAGTGQIVYFCIVRLLPCYLKICKSLAEISLPSSCVSISSKAFSGTSLPSITISGAVKDISPTAFSGCEKLENIYVLNKEADYYDIAGVLYLKPSVDYQIDKNGVNCKDKQLLHTYPGGRKSVEYTIEEGTFAIMEGAFNKNKNLSKVILPEGMIVLNGFAESSISEIELPSTVQIIQDKAFYGTKKLRSISLPASIEKIGNFAFAEGTLKFMNVEALTPPLIYIEAIPNNIVVNVKTESYSSYLKEWESCELTCRACYDDTFIYNIIDNNGTLDLICSRKPLSGNVTIPSTLKAEDELREVREIHQNAFSNENLNSITIPATVTRIGKNAFFYNPELESVTFEDGSNLEFVDDWAFAFEGSLKEFNIPSKAHVSALSLWGNSLSKITVDEKTPWHTVSGGVLYSKAMDTLQVFPRTVVQDKFVLPASVSVMATNDFMLYNNVNNIYVFADTPPTINSLLNINLDLIKTELYVKESALEAYKNSDWKTCHNIIPMTDDEIDGFLTAISDVDTGRVADRGDGAYYTLSGVRVGKPAKGLYIRNGRKVVVR